MIYEATSKLNMELSTPYDQWLCEEAALGFRGLENNTGYPLSNPMNVRLCDQSAVKIKVVLQRFTSIWVGMHKNIIVINLVIVKE